ncbi:Three-deoxy-D-manno-octulosonic-acid transferase domain-containing protein [Pseudopedobacter saltans DSM 12145]|uniref:3-deoxy-D-manno-octulosonic acid transferase n=1 Tax=Pseudopedobacter saltans (strain ATCC 51119 / DSM 12145 / JCM 21818 / CCUG 39354 / LMG 10337 / NBRC 100064 / NCIMB 13643) TaxID=762903 RepID=F0S7W4_PSESL|nr:glycosyltransferase N-terminal domain-containing protein [Pseudopedobacter saltans]ADY54372.1 Three-deoxy-D-manno-octulosonic-acid transferase domain-containing protein [Pseudopedobacter saltans DSM 12145]
MLTFYNIGIHFFFLLASLAALFNNKAKLWIEGRKNWKNKWESIPEEKTVWFHFASLGEFEQGKPLIERIRGMFPDKKIVITFFSPSGYEVRKNSHLGDYILYLPLDTKSNARDFLRIFNPEIAFFNKYEYWFHFFKETHQAGIPLYVTSAIFRPNQIFFKSYGSFNRRILSYASHFFVQNKQSEELLSKIGLNNHTLSGDTRFDSVNDLAKKLKDLPFIDSFSGRHQLFIIGSSWPEDEANLSPWITKNFGSWKAMFAPHEIDEERIEQIIKLFPKGSVIRHSQIADQELSNYHVMIIDNIGMLSTLYSKADLTYIGGGFNKSGIHNTLEAAAWGKAVVFGPNYHKFQEAKDLVDIQAGFSYSTQQELNSVLDKLAFDENYRNQAAKKAKEYVALNIGASEIIINKIYGNLSAKGLI